MRSSNFRLAAGSAAVLAGSALLASAMVYWQITGRELDWTDRLLLRQARRMAVQDATELAKDVGFIRSEDFHLAIGAAGVFDRAHRPLGGALAVWPAGLRADGAGHPVRLPSLGHHVRAVAETLPDGRLLVVAGGSRDLGQLRLVALRAVEVCAVPTALFSLLAGGWLSQRVNRRVSVMRDAIQQIMDGDLRQRLPIEGERDGVDQLAGGINEMLMRLEGLVDEIKGVGDGIAHDLRAPLTRVRNHLARSQVIEQSGEALQATIDRTIGELDQCLRSIGAMLRLAELENGRRRGAFARVDLVDVASDLFDAYEPVAEDAQMVLQLRRDLRGTATEPAPVWVQGDRDLLVEAVGNLVQNAIKFTPLGGQVELQVGVQAGLPFVRVRDTGPGIAAGEREAIFGRFYRAERTAHIGGNGIGLSMVAAIARMHHARVEVGDGAPGAVFTLHFPPDGAAPIPTNGGDGASGLLERQITDAE